MTALKNKKNSLTFSFYPCCGHPGCSSIKSTPRPMTHVPETEYRNQIFGADLWHICHGP